MNIDDPGSITFSYHDQGGACLAKVVCSVRCVFDPEQQVPSPTIPHGGDPLIILILIVFR
jgi:hypothetical protein